MNIPTINTPPQNDTPQPPRQNNFMGLLGIFLVAMGCLILVCVVGAGYLVLRTVITSTSLTPAPTAVISELKASPTAASPKATSAATNQASTQASTQAPTQVVDLTGAMETLKSLGQTVVPSSDPLELARRFNGKTGIAATATGTPPAYKTGDQISFWIVNGDTDKNSQVQAKLAYITPHLYFWIQTGVSYNANELKTLSDTFENKIYPTDREFFGSEWSPGVDNDVHLFILFTRGLGRTTAGYFSSGDEVPPAAYPYSNGHEMFVINADNQKLADPYILGVLAHEFQHMIHWYRDRNEEGWMNEGFSDLAMFLNGYDIGGADTVFASKPDLQFNDWPNDKNATLPHYGASFLFLDYFLNRFGETATQAVVAIPANGLDSIDQVLSDQKAQDSVTHQPVTADDVFTDWTLTNYLKDKNVADGRFTYTNYPQAPKVKDTETIRNCPVTGQARTVSQYAADYIRITCRGNYTLSFQGNREVGVAPASAHSGKYAFWSNKGDDSDMSLSQTFDLSTVTGSVSLSYWTWYDLEEHYDFVYLVASTDDGSTWDMIKTPSATDDNISGNNFGWGYNAKSSGWIQQNVDLSKYAGKKVTLRFDYITDPAVNGEGLMLDDVEIPQLNYKADFEKDNGGWEAAGFVRIQNRLPQTFRVSLIQAGQVTSVQYLTVNPDETVSLPLNLTNDVVLVVSGTTRYTRLPANYSFSIKP